jgi:hypothetical protein
MGDKYAATGAITAVTASPGDTALRVGQPVTTPAGLRAHIHELVFSQGAAPADTVVQWLVRRYTVLGTGSAVVPAPLDSDAPASQLDVDEQMSVEPTFTAATELLDFDLNQRATFRFVSAPGGELMIPNTDSAGIGMTPISASYSGIASVTCHWLE